MMRGMGNMQGMMKQVQKMQKEMAEAQELLNKTEFTGKATNELVKAFFTGDRRMKDIQINEEVVDPDDIEMLEAVGTGVAMGNARDTVKARAAAICRPVEEDGVYYYCLENNLITGI